MVLVVQCLCLLLYFVKHSRAPDNYGFAFHPDDKDADPVAVATNPNIAINQYIIAASTTQKITIQEQTYDVINVISPGGFDVPAHLLLKLDKVYLSARLFANDQNGGNSLAQYEAHILSNIDRDFRKVFPRLIAAESMEHFTVILTKNLGTDLDKMSDEMSFMPVDELSVHPYLLTEMHKVLRGLESMNIKHNNISPQTVGFIEVEENPWFLKSIKVFGFIPKADPNRLFSPWHNCVLPGGTDGWYGGLTLLTVALKNVPDQFYHSVQKDGSAIDTCDPDAGFFEAVKVALMSKYERGVASSSYVPGIRERYSELLDEYIRSIHATMCGSLKKARKYGKRVLII